MPPHPRGPSPHLSWHELHCWDRRVTPWRLLAVYPIDWRADRAPMLAGAFEVIRAACADRTLGYLPIRVLSGYRTPEWNATVGGAKRSQHVQGRALDLEPPLGWTVEDFYTEIVRLAQSDCPTIRGVGRYRTFVHVDVRPVEHLVRWEGKRPQAEVVA